MNAWEKRVMFNAHLAMFRFIPEDREYAAWALRGLIESMGGMSGKW